MHETGGLIIATHKLGQMKRYKILYLITQGILGGAQTHVCHLALHLKEKFDVHVAMGVKGPLFDKLNTEGVSVYYIPSLVREISPGKDFIALLQLIKLLKDIRPDLISTHSSKAGILGRLAARLLGIPSIFTAHGWAFTEGVSNKKRKFYIKTEKMAARWASKIICVSEYDRQLALGSGVGSKNQLVTIHNGMPLIPGHQLADPSRENPVRLIMVARLSDQKDHRLLFEALAGVSVNKNFVVDLVGDGPLFSQHKEIARQMGLTGIVNFWGARTDVPELLSKAQGFLLISKWEGFPRSILEAMRAGLPVIASDVGGTRESVIDGETGFLVPRGDADTLRDRLLQLINDTELRVRMGRKGRERFLKHFTFERMLAKTIEVYEDVFAKSGKRD